MVTTITESLRAVVAEVTDGGGRSVADRLTALGYDVVAHVAAGRDAVDAVRRFGPDAVVLETRLTDGLGVLVAQAVTRTAPGVAALVLSAHPAVIDPAMRPRWGAVSLLPSSANAADLDYGVREAVARARALMQPDGATVELPEEMSVDAEAAEGEAAEGEAAEGDVAAGDVVAGDVAVGDLVDEDAVDDDGMVAVADDVMDDVAGDPLTEVEDESLIVERAIEAVCERAGLTPDAAMALMEQEADDSGQTLLDVARAMLVE
jgi:DNA-binding response OmpR family regulator